MKILVPVKLVPDLVEELEIDESGTALDTTWLRLILSEFDDHAIEQAVLLKERGGGQVTVVAPEAEGVDDVLYNAAARGADRLIKLSGDLGRANNHVLARLFAAVARAQHPDLILTGVQAHNDLDGPMDPLLAEHLGLPYVGYVAGVELLDGKVVARKEYSGGLVAEMEVALPAVLGIQAAEQPPRYVAISKVRQAMASAEIQEQQVLSLLTADELEPVGGPTVERMFQPEVGERAQILEGDEDEVADRLVEIFRELGVL